MNHEEIMQLLLSIVQTENTRVFRTNIIADHGYNQRLNEIGLPHNLGPEKENYYLLHEIGHWVDLMPRRAIRPNEYSIDTNCSSYEKSKLQLNEEIRANKNALALIDQKNLNINKRKYIQFASWGIATYVVNVGRCFIGMQPWE